MEFYSKQELFEKHMKRAIDKTLKILHPDSDDEHGDGGEVERLRERKRVRDQPFAVLGPPGSGKTTRAKSLIRYVKAQGGDVLFTFPTGQMQSRLRADTANGSLSTYPSVNWKICKTQKSSAECQPATSIWRLRCSVVQSIGARPTWNVQLKT